MAKKKLRTVEDIITEYQGFRHHQGKSFEERIHKFESLLDPANIDGQIIAGHAHYAVFGHPSDKHYPGAYNSLVAQIEAAAPDHSDKVSQDMLAKILESYVDSMLMHTHGKEVLDRIAGIEGVGEQELREFKGRLLTDYLNEGKQEKDHIKNILARNNLETLSGEKRVNLLAHFRKESESIRDSYSGKLRGELQRDLFSEADRFDMADYITPRFESAGWKSPVPHVLFDADAQGSLYAALLQGQTDGLKRNGFKYEPPKPKSS